MTIRSVPPLLVLQVPCLAVEKAKTPQPLASGKFAHSVSNILAQMHLSTSAASGFRIHLRKTEASNAVQCPVDTRGAGLCRRNITWSHSHTLSSCINLIMHRFWSVTDVMHYENVYCTYKIYQSFMVNSFFEASIFWREK